MRYLPIALMVLVVLACVAGCSGSAPQNPGNTQTQTGVNQQPAASSAEVVANANSQVDANVVDTTDDVQIGEMI